MGPRGERLPVLAVGASFAMAPDSEVAAPAGADGEAPLSVLLVEDSAMDARLIVESLRPHIRAGRLVVQPARRLTDALTELRRMLGLLRADEAAGETRKDDPAGETGHRGPGAPETAAVPSSTAPVMKASLALPKVSMPG